MWVNAESILVNLSDIELKDYCSSSRDSNGDVSTAPVLFLICDGQEILLRGKTIIKKFLRLYISDYDEAPEGMWDFLMSEHEKIQGVEAPSFIDEINALKGISKPSFMSVVGYVGGSNPFDSKRLYDGFRAIGLYAADPNHSFNIDFLSDYILSDIQYGFSVWRSSRKKSYINIGSAKVLTTNFPATLTVYDFGKAFGVSSRFECGLRPHLMYEVKRGIDEIQRLKDCVVKSLSELFKLDSKIKLKNLHNILNPSRYNGLLSLEQDELEASDTNRIDLF